MTLVEPTADAARSAPSNFRAARVVRVLDVTPRMRRVTLAAEDIARFDAYDLHVKLVIPEPDRPLVCPAFGQDAEGARRDVAVRTYTIRRIDVSKGELDVDMVRHADGGPGARFAETARVGDRVGVIGPGGRNVERADWTLLAGDETALPAIGRILEGMPRAAIGTALISIADEAERQPLQAPQGVVVHWRVRPAGSAADTLLAAVQAVSFPAQGSIFAWAGAEFATIQSIRTHWRNIGLGKDRQLAVAYWRRWRAMDSRP